MQNNQTNKKALQNVSKTTDKKVAETPVDHNYIVTNSDHEEEYKKIFSKMQHTQLVREYRKVQRNELCPCGSGKKYKNCCQASGKFEHLVVKK